MKMDYSNVLGAVFTSSLFLYMLSTLRLFSTWKAFNEVAKKIDDLESVQRRKIIERNQFRNFMIKTNIWLCRESLSILRLDPPIKEFGHIFQQITDRTKENEILLNEGISDEHRNQDLLASSKRHYEQLEPMESKIDGFKLESDIAFGIYTISLIFLYFTGAIDISGVFTASLIVMIMTFIENITKKRKKKSFIALNHWLTELHQSNEKGKSLIKMMEDNSDGTAPLSAEIKEVCESYLERHNIKRKITTSEGEGH